MSPVSPGLRVQWTVTNVTYHVEILLVSSLAGVSVEWTIMSCDLVPSPVKVIGHQVDEIQISAVHVTGMMSC